jgi:hypothetical protein
MAALTAVPPDRHAAAEIAAGVLRRHRNVLRELRVEVIEGRAILSGVAHSYYGKQLAQHEVLRRTDLVLLANRIVVRGPAPGS